MNKNTLHILGTRGTVPVSGDMYRRYGGATTCFFLRLGGNPLVIDAGTGFLSLPRYLACGEDDLPLILTHPHADHLQGLLCSPYMFRRGSRLRLYAANDLRDALDRQFSPPLWPVGVWELPTGVSFSVLDKTTSVGAFSIETMPGRHPGGVTLLRITGFGKTVVIITDCTVTRENGTLDEAIVSFAENCDLLLCDGQYTDEEWREKSTFGHSAMTDAARLGAACGARSVRVIHHDPTHTDGELDRYADTLRALCPAASFAYEEEEIPL